MNPYVNEEVMWQRLKDIQLEAENRRLLGTSTSAFSLAWMLGKRAWLLAGQAIGRATRRHAKAEVDERHRVSDVA